MKIEKTTPILVVEAIEPLLPLWTKRLGYTKTVEVAHGERLGFVILVQGEREIMLQTAASIEADVAAVAQRLRPGAIVLYNDVASLADAKKATRDLELLIPERKTFYGAKEIWVLAPDGQVLGFAEHVEE